MLTTGGTGLTPTDRTPEVTRALLDLEVPGIAEAIRAAGVAAGVPTAVLSRGLAGVVGSCLVVNLPGSRGGVKDGLRCSSRCCPRGRAGRRERPLSDVGWPVPADPRRGHAAAARVRPTQAAWRAARRRNADWLTPWDATVPPGGDGPADDVPPAGAPAEPAGPAAARRYPFAVEVDGRFAGQLTVNNIVRGSAQFASIGYWIDRGTPAAA